MKRFISALAFCSALLALLSVFLFPPVKAKEDPITVLLSLPAPPPPNPFVTRRGPIRDQDFYSRRNPPRDDAPIQDLIDYWTQSGIRYRGPLNFTSRPSEITTRRLAAEMAKKPELATALLNVLPDSKDAIDAVKDLYDRVGTEGGPNKEQKNSLKQWLRMHSSYFSRDLERVSSQIKDEGGYVTLNEENNLLALTRHNYSSAEPLINRLYLDSSQPVSKALATWALYRHAMESGSISDTERYRSELMRMVEDRTLPDGVRDKAYDALTHEPDFPGRAEWSFSLYGDETLVNMPRFTMLTTLIMYMPPETYVPKMIEMIEKTSSPTIRLAAARNLIIALQGELDSELEREVIKTLLPALEDRKWLGDEQSGYIASTALRAMLVQKLSQYEMPEAVPGLIKALDEKQKRLVPNYSANAAVNTMKPANRAAANYPSNRDIDVRRDMREVESFELRSPAVAALAKQKDPRAVPALRRILPEGESYERSRIVKALLDCGGFSVAEQLDALELAAKGIRAEMDNEAANAPRPDYNVPTTIVNPIMSVNGGVAGRTFQISGPEIKQMLAQQLLGATEISDELARAVVDRIEGLDKTDRETAAVYRKMILRWQNGAINLLLLSDVKHGIADTDTIVRLLSQRKALRERQGPDVFDLRTGTRTAIGISACLIEDTGDYDGILESGDAETKTAMLACARLIRAKLPVAKVGENLKGPMPALAVAAERYLESEDSPEARAIVLSRHPGEAKILGATTAFHVEGGGETAAEYLWALYQSLGNDSLYNGWVGSGNDDELETIEKSVRAEVKTDETLLGVYSYDKNYIRIYQDRVVFSWDEDESRYRERPMSKEEFEYIKAYLIENKADELPPFLACGGGYCTAEELIMVGRNGGRRVYTNGESDFFSGLDKYFAELKKTPAMLRYALSREIPGLEIILASDDLHVETVWKNGGDLRVAASLTAVRERVKKDIEKAAGQADSEGAADEENTDPDPQTLKADMARNREYDGYGWHKIVNGADAGPVEQPAGVEFIPLKDSLSVKPTEEQWKARYGSVEVRSADDGVYLVSGGRVVVLKKGNFGYPVMSANGRWAVVGRIPGEDDDDGQMFRINIATRRVYPVAFPESERYSAPKEAVAFIPVLNKFLIVPQSNYYGDEDYTSDVENGPDDTVIDDADPGTIQLLDPETGLIQNAVNELRPLAQQTFRPLQKAAQPDEFWAAMPDAEKNETRVGIYNAKWLTFKAVRTIPKIKFNSMGMWVDEAGGKVYFVYRGHLLALPLNK